MARRQRRKDVVTSNTGVGVYYDHQRRTCLLVETGDALVKFIPLDISEGFQCHETSRMSFDQRYKLMADYPLERAAQLYLNYSLAVGATVEVLDQLARFTSVGANDRETALSRRAATEQFIKPKAVKQTVKKEVRRSTRKKRRSTPEGYTSAAKMFQALIMEGTSTDDEIFAAVQAAFDLDDKKRNYVAWYRKHLTKQGKNPPPALD